MHRFEITGETPEALYFNAVNMLAIFLRPPQTIAATPPTPSTPLEEVHEGQAEASPVDKVIAKKRGAKAKAEPLVPDEIGDLGVKEAKVLTLDGDIRPMLRAIQKACTERGMDMPACVGYVQKLYGPFGIAKADQLMPAQYAEFMEASDAYLKGEA